VTDEHPKPPERQLTIRTANSVTPKRVRWLWRDRIPLGEMTLIVGRGGVGKSTLICTLIAWITTGRMKGEFFGRPRDVLYVVNEDSLEYTVVPRLIAAGADLERVHFTRARIGDQYDRVQFPTDCARIAEAAEHFHAVAAFFDPITSNLTAKKNDQDEMRSVLERLRRTTEQAGIAGIGLAHTRKAMSTNVLDAIMGSVELGNVTRSVMGVVADPDEDGAVVLSQEKNNLGRMDLESFRYKISSALLAADDTSDQIETGRLEWLTPTDRKTSDILHDQIATPFVSKTTVEEAMEFLRTYLMSKGGQALRGEIINTAQKEGFSRPTVERAAKRMKIVSIYSGQGAAKLWCLDPSASA
jgi:energy-coupling factor transporter ATP-binding protein EcfA2